MAHDVFVSHSSKDKPTADAVCAMLESQGIRCWVAPRDITPGMDWGEAIVEAVKGARVMVLVFSASANSSPQIKREVERAVNKGIPVIPLRIEDVAPTASLEYFISTPHWLDAFTPPLETHLKYLAQIIQQVLGRRSGEPLVPAPSSNEAAKATVQDAKGYSAPASARQRVPMFALVGGFVGLLIILVAAWWFGVERPRREQMALLHAKLTAGQGTGQPAPTNVYISSVSPNTNSVKSIPAPPTNPIVVIPAPPSDSPIPNLSPPSDSVASTNLSPTNPLVASVPVPTNPPVAPPPALTNPSPNKEVTSTNPDVVQLASSNLVSTIPPAPTNKPLVVPLTSKAGAPSVFALIKEANKDLDEICRDSIVEIRGDKSAGDAIPTKWHLVFFNPTAKLKATEFIFQSGRKISKTDPWRVLEVLRADNVIPKAKLKIDSDAAFQIIATNQLMEGVTLKMSEVRLELKNATPVWQIQLWAAKHRNPRDLADLGKIFISAETGDVIKNELQPKHIY